MIRKDLPYISATDPGAGLHPCQSGHPVSVAVARVICGHSMHDDETGDADTGPAWFARIDIPPGGTLADLLRTAQELAPEEDAISGVAFPAFRSPSGRVLWPRAARPFENGDGFAGLIYGRDSDGFEFCGTYATGPELDRAWRFLQGTPDPSRWLDFRREHVPPPDGQGIRVELAKGFRGVGVAFCLVADSGADLFVQFDADRPAIAALFGFERVGPLGCGCRETDGSIPCPDCGKEPGDYAGEATAYLAKVCGSGVRVEDPGYFTDAG